MRRWIVPVFLPLLGAALVLTGVIFGGQALRSQLKQHNRYTTAFADIECSAPPRMEQEQFLAEVRKISDLPERLPVLDEELAGRLKTAFARHPWVQEVDEVLVGRDRRIAVKLHFREPVLAVPQGDGARVVDGHGVLLAKNADASGLPVWRGHSTTPTGKPGEPWGDRAVEAAAQVVGLLRGDQDKLHLAAALAGGGEVTLTTHFRSRILWGRPPGKEQSGEPSAEIKRERLLEHCRKHGDLDHPKGPCEHDVRAVQKASPKSP
jgi:hypothetical protein